MKNENSLVKIDLKIRENYIFASIESKTQTSKQFYSDMSYLKIELLEIGIQGENNEEITMYGIHFRKNEEYEEIFHESKTKIIGLFSYFKAYGILSN